MDKILNSEGVGQVVRGLKNYVDRSNENLARLKTVSTDELKTLLDNESYEAGVIYAAY